MAKQNRSTKADRIKQLEEILDLKAQGWSDPQIQKDLKLTPAAFTARLRELSRSETLKVSALYFLSETFHRLRWVRMKALTDYEKYKEKNANASIAALKRVIEIDVAVPKIAEQMGWKVDDLAKYIRQEKTQRKQKGQSEDELYAEYRSLVKSEA